MSVVLVEASGPVRTVTLNRPEKRNAMNQELLRALHGAFLAEPPAEERVAVIRANGPAFCAGIDLRERLDGGPSSDPIDIEEVLDRIQNYPLPVVAVVQGDAIAGGNELALHCDFVVASSEARFGMSLAQIGLAPSWFLAKKIVEVGGPVAAREILLLGDPLPAQRMHDLGIIARVAPPAELEQAASAVIDRLAANAPLSLRAMKALLVRQMDFRGDIAHDDVDRLIQLARTSEDAREGMAARLEKRAPNFRGV
jgi:enoyl-CoA hydratase/carnithine racemase